MTGANGSNGNGAVALKGFSEAVQVVDRERFASIKSLTQNERLQAHKRAIKYIEGKAGAKPEFVRSATISAYPGWIIGVVVALSMVVLVMAFLPSAMRLYHIGYATFFETMGDGTLSRIGGYSLVVMAEASAVLFTVALSVIGSTVTQRRILLGSVVGSAALALSGNYYVALDGHELTAFTVLEAMLPPLMTLSTAYVLKELLLKTIHNRHEDRVRFQEAVVAWEAQRTDPETHPKFEQAYANELQQAIFNKNKKDDIRAMMAEFGPAEWTLLVNRERNSENWYGGAAAVDLPFA